MSHLTILRGTTPSTKVYTVENGMPKKGKVMQSYSHDSITVEDVDSLQDLYEYLALVRNDPNAYIIRGAGRESSMTGVRRTKIQNDKSDGEFFEHPTQWVCIDIDGYTDIPAGIKHNSHEAIEYIIQAVLPPLFTTASYIYQLSSSAGIEYRGSPVKAGSNFHLFFWLSRALINTELEDWLAEAKARGADNSVWRTVTPIYVGNHVVLRDGVIDTICEEDRFGVTHKAEKQVYVPTIAPRVQHTSSGVIDIDDTNEIMNALRNADALYKEAGSWIKLKHPREKTAGDWFVKKTDPRVVHHHTHASMRVDRWLKEFYGIDTRLSMQTSEEKASINSLKQRLAALKRA
jgi:hypothetical protein